MNVTRIFHSMKIWNYCQTLSPFFSNPNWTAPSPPLASWVFQLLCHFLRTSSNFFFLPSSSSFSSRARLSHPTFATMHIPAVFSLVLLLGTVCSAQTFTFTTGCVSSPFTGYNSQISTSYTSVAVPLPQAAASWLSSLTLPAAP